MQQMRWSREMGLKGLLLGLCLAVVLLGLAYGESNSGAGLPKAYAEGPVGTKRQNWSTGPVTPSTQPSGQISYQGRLLQNGTPYNGNIQIMFNLYGVASGGMAWWSETQTVSVSQGLFTVMLGAVNPISSVNFQSQAWLGIQPAGAASELAPRQLLGAAPYAMSLIPGATVYDPSAPGGYISSLWVNGGNHVGIVAVSGYTGTNGLQATATGNDSHAVSATYSGTSTSCPSGAAECASALYAQTAGDAYGMYVNATMRSALIITDTSSFWHIYDEGTSTSNGISTAGKLNVGGYATFGGGKSGYVVDIALNDDSVPLERGDVVVISGFAAPVVGEVPVPRVMRATEANSTGVMGVVDALYVPCDQSRKLRPGEPCGGFQPDVAVIQPNQYLSVVTLGAYKAMKVDATASPIHPGDLLATTSANGRGMKAVQIQLASSGVQFYAPGTVVGKALAGLNQGTGTIPVFVSAR